MAAGGIDRRTLIGSAVALAAAPAAARRKPASTPPSPAFTHGVASGEPGPDRMLFWTRHQPESGRPAPLRVEIAADPAMTHAKVAAKTAADPERDWTARAVVEGLSPGRTYYYRFRAEDGSVSDIGRTRTLPDSAAAGWRLGAFACGPFSSGWFNAAAAAVAADDCDLLVDLGSDLHAPRPGVRGSSGFPATREGHWAKWREARADPDLRALHQRWPMVALWDWHRAGLDGWAGAPAAGPADRDVARLAFADWMPVSDQPFARYDIGRLATLYRLDTAGRDPALAPAAGADLARLRDEQWVAGRRQMLGEAQEAWLFSELSAAVRRGTRWQILAGAPRMADIVVPPEPALPDAALSPALLADVRARRARQAAGLPADLEGWSGYPAARARLLAMAQAAAADLVLLSGATHQAFAAELAASGRPAAVELGCPSLTAPGLEAAAAAPDTVAAALMAASPGLRWLDSGRRGWLHLDLTPGDIAAEWRLTGPAGSRSAALVASVRAHVPALQHRLVMG
jgi:alkaline phosphatase D